MIRQLYMGEFAVIVAALAGAERVDVGAGTAHMRSDGPLPHSSQPRGRDVLRQAFVVSRVANDQDGYLRFDTKDPAEVADRTGNAIEGAAGPGLGGIVMYEITSLEVDKDGHAVAMVRATPVGDPSAEPVEFEYDAKSPRSQAHVEKSVGFAPAAHRFMPFDFPGYNEPPVLLPPTEFMLADMLLLATGPRKAGEGGLDGHWCRPKDLFTLYQLITTGTDELDGDLLKFALDNNYNTPPGVEFDIAGYEMRGRKNERIEIEEGKTEDGLVVWTAGADGYRDRQPVLEGHPTAGHMMATAVSFLRGLAVAGEGAKFRDGTWFRADGTPVPPEPVKAYDLTTARGVRVESRETVWLTPPGPSGARSASAEESVSAARITSQDAAHAFAAAQGMPRVSGVRNAQPKTLRDTAPELVAVHTAAGVAPGTDPACYAPWAITRPAGRGDQQAGVEQALGV
ncbi:MAG: hypothetical protein HOV68_25200 [Streptomycetaceae bacterium]|nr:hypothetical protein [Streptomycetaceae bacterium]